MDALSLKTMVHRVKQQAEDCWLPQEISQEVSECDQPVKAVSHTVARSVAHLQSKQCW